MDYNRSKRWRDCSGNAAYGSKLVSLCTIKGLSVIYELVPANTDERLAAESVFYALRGCRIYADKGSIGVDWQERIFRHTRNRINTTKRANQADRSPASFYHWRNRIRERTDGVCNEIQNTVRNIKCL